MEELWKTFEIRELSGRQIEERSGHRVILDQENGVIIHTTENTDLEKTEEKIKNYSQIRKHWGSKYIEVYEPGTEFINATLIVTIDWRNNKRTVVL